MKPIILLLVLAFASANVMYYNQENWIYSSGYWGHLVISSQTIFNVTYYDGDELVGRCNNTDYCNMYAKQVNNLIEPDRQYSAVVTSISTKYSSSDYFTASVRFYDNTSWIRDLIFWTAFYGSFIIVLIGVLLYVLSCSVSKHFKYRKHAIIAIIVTATSMIVSGAIVMVLSFLGIIQLF